MAGFLSAIKNRGKQIDEAVGEKTEPTPFTLEGPGNHAQNSDSLPKPAEGRKWDDYLQKYVNESEWKSPQQHREEEDAAKAKGFKKASE
jgi:hypothetical protein